MKKVGASGDDALRTFLFVVLTIRPALTYVSEMTSGLCLCLSAVRLGKAASSA